LTFAQALPLHAVIGGTDDGIPIILLTGLGQQAIDWPDGFLSALAIAGYRLIRPDNRDAGLSPACGPEMIDSLTIDDFPDAGPLRTPPVYRLQDMAIDVIGLMDRLQLGRVHLIGYSMGGMIAQIVAARYPERVLSLTVLMSSAGQEWIDCQDIARMAMARTIVAEKDAAARIAAHIADHAVYTGSAYPIEVDRLQMHAAAAIGRSYRPAGIWRQACAIRGSGDRRDLLRRITAPTLVLHGDEDRCIALAQAREMLNLVAGCDMQVLPQAGHDLHPALAMKIVPKLLRHLEGADASSRIATSP